MRSRPNNRLAFLGVALYWLFAGLVARRRAGRRQDQAGAEAGAAGHGGRAFPWLWLLATTGAAAVIGAIAYTGYAYKASREQRAAAIALTAGDPDRAPELMLFYGCGGCHTIPGVRGARGLVGPPLTGIGRRVYIAGVLTNTPDHLIQWIVNPRAVDPKTAMPVTGISPEEARHVAAFLYAGG